MAFRCPNCGGDIVFDVDTQMMKCRHCGGSSSPDSFSVVNVRPGEDRQEDELTHYTCGGCGAELQGTDESAVGFCPYCGGQSLLKTSGKDEHAEFIMPFQISKQRCAGLYGDFAKKVRYLPKELKKHEYLESFTGIYMPYYEYDVDVDQFSFQGSRTEEHNRKYDVVNTYSFSAETGGGYCSVPFDGSRYLDDEIAERALPFDMRKQRPFNPAYFSGFYADTSTVPADIYYEDAGAQVAEDVMDEASDIVKKKTRIAADKKSADIKTSTRGYHTAFFPMWFLTWRKDDRVAYAVVNGESGKVVSDLPVDTKSFAIGCVITAAVVFLLLELLFQPTPVITSAISLIAGMIMSVSVKSSTKRIFEKQTHANDKGWEGRKMPSISVSGMADGDQNQIKVKTSKSKSNVPFAFLVFFITMAVVLGGGFVLNSLGIKKGDIDDIMDNISIPHIIAVIALITVIYSTIKTLKWQGYIPEKHPMIAAVIVLAAVIINAATVFISPVDDIWYYLGDAVCILILIGVSAIMIRVYNIGTTRPLPKLFGRNEADV